MKEEAIACPHCLAENDPSRDFCENCGAPLSSFATVGPFECIQADGFAHREAVTRPRKPIVVVGVWLLNAPVIIATCVMLFVAPYTCVFFGPLSLVAGILIFKTTRNYLHPEIAEAELQKPFPMRTVVTALCIIVVAGAAVLAIWLPKRHAAIRKYRAQWDTAMLIIAYMRDHGGAWPRAWKDLERTLHASSPAGRWGIPWEEIREHVAVDFSLTAKQLAGQTNQFGDSSFKAVMPKDGSVPWYHGPNPNLYIRVALEEEEAEQ